jgi:hypothetical protein
MVFTTDDENVIPSEARNLDFRREISRKNRSK